MGIDTIRESLPAYAKDTRLNLGSVTTTSSLTPQQLWGTLVATAVASRNAVVLREIAEEAAKNVSPEALEAAKAAASIMAMNNVYYRGKHLIGDEAYQSLPARLRMQVIGNPGVDKVDFELWCLAVSAVTGCGVCLESHEKTLVKAGASREHVHDALRIAAVVHAAAVTLDAESALAGLAPLAEPAARDPAKDAGRRRVHQEPGTCSSSRQSESMTGAAGQPFACQWAIRQHSRRGQAGSVPRSATGTHTGL